MLKNDNYFKLTRTADQTGKTTRNRSTNASFFVITAADNSLIPIIFSSRRHCFFRVFQLAKMIPNSLYELRDSTGFLSFGFQANWFKLLKIRVDSSRVRLILSCKSVILKRMIVMFLFDMFYKSKHILFKNGALP